MRLRSVILALVAAIPLLLGAAPPAVSSLTAPAAGHVVVLEDGVDASMAAEQLLAPLGLAPDHVYEHALNGFAVTAPAAVAEGLAASPLVAYVEADRTFTVTAQSTPAGIDRIDADTAVGAGSGAAVDVDVAVIDTGVDGDHPDLNVHRQVDCTSAFLGLVSFGNSGCEEGTGDDDHGHGTHVSGTVGAIDDGSGVVGVAPGARIWGIKVLGGPLGSGPTSDVIAGIDYATARASEIEVVNMSLGGPGTSRATDDAIRAATDAGIVVVVAAGNDGADASGYTPANAPTAITVSAITDLDGRPGGQASGSCSGGDDEFATYSNHGDIVDLAAPGSCVVSTAVGGGTTSMSGTSMASPHVAGAAAWYVATNQLPSTASRWSSTLSGLLGTAASQDGACGFAQGVSDEPLLDLDGC